MRIRARVKENLEDTCNKLQNNLRIIILKNLIKIVTRIHNHLNLFSYLMMKINLQNSIKNRVNLNEKSIL